MRIKLALVSSFSIVIKIIIFNNRFSITLEVWVNNPIILVVFLRFILHFSYYNVQIHIICIIVTLFLLFIILRLLFSLLSLCLITILSLELTVITLRLIQFKALIFSWLLRVFLYYMILIHIIFSYYFLVYCCLICYGLMIFHSVAHSWDIIRHYLWTWRIFYCFVMHYISLTRSFSYIMFFWKATFHLRIVRLLLFIIS